MDRDCIGHREQIVEVVSPDHSGIVENGVVDEWIPAGDGAAERRDSLGECPSDTPEAENAHGHRAQSPKRPSRLRRPPSGGRLALLTGESTDEREQQRHRVRRDLLGRLVGNVPYRDPAPRRFVVIDPVDAHPVDRDAPERGEPIHHRCVHRELVDQKTDNVRCALGERLWIRELDPVPLEEISLDLGTIRGVDDQNPRRRCRSHPGTLPSASASAASRAE